MIGVELVANPVTRAPLPAADVSSIWEQCKDMGVLIGKGGYFGNVFRYNLRIYSINFIIIYGT